MSCAYALTMTARTQQNFIIRHSSQLPHNDSHVRKLITFNAPLPASDKLFTENKNELIILSGVGTDMSTPEVDFLILRNPLRNFDFGECDMIDLNLFFVLAKRLPFRKMLLEKVAFPKISK